MGNNDKNRNEIAIKPAKGRPMLTWVGKRPLRHVTAFPAQLVEKFESQSSLANPQSAVWEDWPDAYPRSGLLFHGDNKEVLAHLLANGFRGKVKLIYIDPPFDSGADYVRKVSLRGAVGTAKLDGESYTLGEQVQYTDIWANDSYLQFMYERLLLLKELLAEDGSIYLHCDWHQNHFLRCILDEVFGAQGLIAELAWKRSDSHNDATFYGVVHDSILAYSKSGNPQFNRLFIPLSKNTADKWYRHVEPGTGRRYNLGNLVSPHPRPNLTYEWKGIRPPAMGWRCSKARMAELDANGLLVVVGAGDKQTLKVKQYLDESKGRLLSTWWDDISQLRGYSGGDERSDYPTQKPEALLERIIQVSSNPGDLVLDCFIGSGATSAVAQGLGRRWIACDINKGAIQTTAKRLMAVISEQAENVRQSQEKPTLPEVDAPEPGATPPAQLSFAVYRVNDYDLHIQHNEAVELACEHIGVTRNRSDAFFDGTLGKRLVKIIPFGHPVTPLDLEEVKRELAARPDEDRDVVVVCLGKELAADAWLEEWNRLRKRGDVPNKIEVIELRTDPKYGGFITHQPADARVTVERTETGRLRITILDFISPTIIERLKQQSNLLTPQIDDWRAMVDSVMIDAAYDGHVFNVTLADVPESKTDLVAGVYEMDAPAGETTVAVKVTDMLGEEVLKTASVKSSRAA